MKFENKVVLVTGAARGIGKATALLFAKEGAKLIVNYSKSEKEANELVQEIKKIGSDAIAIKCDVSEEEQVKKMFETAIKKFGKIDVLVNNAGIVFDLPIEEKTIAQWKRTMDVNLLGTFLCSKHAMLIMKKQNSGAIVNVSSNNALNSFGAGEEMDYNATKAGIITLTRDFSRKLAPFGRVNCVAPGWVDTDLNKELPKELIERETKKIGLKRFAKPEEIAKAILFLASDDASYVSGSTLLIDGAYG